MTTANGETQSQEALQTGAANEGAAPGIQQDPNVQPPLEGSQPTGDQTGTENAEKPAERTFSQAEVDKMTSAYQRDTQLVKDQLLALTRQTQVEKATTAETSTQSDDQRAVDDGEITQAEARQRQVQRSQDRTTAAQRAEETATHNAMMTQGEKTGKILMAHELAIEMGIDAKVLIEDESIMDQGTMLNKARELVLDKREAALVGTESYDSGKTNVGAGGAASYVQKLKSGEPLPSTEDIDRLTSKYLT